MRASERKLQPRPEQREPLPSPPRRRLLPRPAASLPAATGFGESVVGSTGGPLLQSLGREHWQLSSELEADLPQAGFDMGHEQFGAGTAAEPPQAGFDMGHGLLEADLEGGHPNLQTYPVLGGWDAQPFGPRQYNPQLDRYEKQLQWYRSSLPLPQEATRLVTAQSRNPRQQSWLVDDCVLLVGSRALRVRSYALPAGGTVVLEVDGSIVQCDGNLPFTWADFAAWPPETFLSVDGLVFRTVAFNDLESMVCPSRDANPEPELFGALL